MIYRRPPLRGIVLTLACIAALILPSLARAEEATPQAFLTALYHRYEGKHPRGVDYADARALARYLEPSLVALIMADRAAAAKRDEVPALDGDPFIDAQDGEITRLAVTTAIKRPDKATGTVTFRNSGKAMRLRLDLVRLEEGWRIADIVWPEGSLRGLYTDNH